MKAKKLPSGNYRVQVLDYIDKDGKQRKKSFTAPTKEEAILNAIKFKNERTEGGTDGTVEDMVKRAIREKQSALSPSTYRGYEKVLRTNISMSPFGKVRVGSLNSQKVQSWVSWMIGKGLSPKSIKNALGVFTSSYQFYGGEKIFKVKMPQLSSKRKHVPSVSDVKMILDYFKDDPDMTAAIRLGAFAGLRRGEMCALTSKDVNREKKSIRVNKAITETSGGEWVLKVPKTSSSVRMVPVSNYVLDSLPKTGNCIKILPSQVTNRFCRAVKNLPVEPFSLHDLRHFHASMAHNRGVSDITIQTVDGWSSPATMKGTYWGEISEETREQMDKLNAYVDSVFV